MGREAGRRSRIAFAAFGAIVLLIFLGNFDRAIFLYERAALALAPSSERASAYGERHFDAERPAFYDIARAEYFYEKAVELDDQYPYAHHQLARISFLRGLRVFLHDTIAGNEKRFPEMAR
ncbi:hypothetical protein A3C21_02925 [Candidatus Kaiserbacteria bacterium RIFCSPHIGHO2_02_FULL_59_21]|uniref:Tetratricopeptide repeat protein n=2 Tax=Candidatus Kaiseribacteriota TaxID=1752734 RepID=A0A0G1YRF8_9BACT|nr:MAG: hypothetical protein UY98_C0037G0002 [Candidatus Kaiserbacteria bacterium GW2011_GWA2_58_9]OGG63382.1 MAG: hypothetical protein A2766_04015 [Candidatus Kaiserbacteria bacterium RIFCSPHIGHO2_01_FULL_58_22]OGG66617.1 MAG: hypothetical protein A3C21_02925 [Candidatus Kaiserbacteria bacterium RIFCSPHIGHO2_02_FULL_59_21]OGG79008.1 MAG: hypothetical protein A2952_01430 [Candidatus Kaiserbacteria bacterium RIFCSPLOWO2_01_FULL_59_34]OGG84368.1 MAG: hypothetical protein A3I47_01775 [Candidatus K